MSDEKEPSLIERAQNITTHKEPGLTEKVVNKAADTFAGAKEKVSQAWLYSDDDIETEVEVEEIENTGVDKQVVKKNTDADYRSSAETMTGLYDLVLGGGFTWYETTRLKKAFTNAEWKKVKEVKALAIKDLKGDDIELRKKIDRCFKKYASRKDEIEMKPDEIIKTEKGFYRYYKAADKVISPETQFYATIALGIFGRLTDTAFDEGYN